MTVFSKPTYESFIIRNMNKILYIIHISDLHIEKRLSQNYEAKIGRAVDAITPLIGCNCPLFVVVSGDIAFSGAIEEYENAERVLQRFVKTLEDTCGERPRLILTPGNHDIKGPDEIVPRERNCAAKCREDDKLENFFMFSTCMGLDWECEDAAKCSYALDEEAGFDSVSFCVLNTAPFSTKTFDKGAHTLSDYALSLLNKESNRELSILVCHHGMEWLDDSPRLELQADSLTSIDLAIVGHEHRGGTVLQQFSAGGKLLTFRGDTFSLDDEKECGFSLIAVGALVDNEYTVCETGFTWDSSARIFTSFSGESWVLVPKGPMPKPRDDYLLRLPDDIGEGDRYFETSFSFPRLHVKTTLCPSDDEGDLEMPLVIEHMDDFFSYLAEQDCIEVEGFTGSGKSCLARAIYLECVKRGYSPVLIHPENSSKSFARTLSALIGEQYGDRPFDLARFDQAPRAKKVLIADDFDRVKKRKENSPDLLIREMLGHFGKVIITVPESFDVLSRFATGEKVVSEFRYGALSIGALTKLVRDPLVKKRCRAAGLSEDAASKMVRAVDRAVSGHSGLFELTPVFVIQYVDYFLDNRDEMMSQEELPFNHIFDSNIRKRIDAAIKSLHIQGRGSHLADIATVALQELAFAMHERRTSVLSAGDASAVIMRYGREREIDVSPRDILEIAAKAKILRMREDGCSYTFAGLSIHSYFVAKRIDTALDLRDSDIEGHIERLLDEIWFPVNSEIVVFLTHLRTSLDFPKELVRRANALVGDKVAEGLFDSRKHVSLAPLVEANLTPMDGKGAELAESVEDDIEERRLATSEEIEYADYYDNDMSHLERPSVQALTARRYVDLASGYLVKQYATMPKDGKREIRDAIFRIPPLVAELLVTEIDARSEELLCEVDAVLSERIDDAASRERMARRFISAFALASIIATMLPVVTHAAEGSVTIEYLLKAEGDFPEDRMTKLLALLCGDDQGAFARQAAQWAKEARKSGRLVELVAIQMVANRYLIEHRRLDVRIEHSLRAQVFNESGDSLNVKRLKASGQSM